MKEDLKKQREEERPRGTLPAKRIKFFRFNGLFPVRFESVSDRAGPFRLPQGSWRNIGRPFFLPAGGICSLLLARARNPGYTPGPVPRLPNDLIL